MRQPHKKTRCGYCNALLKIGGVKDYYIRFPLPDSKSGRRVVEHIGKYPGSAPAQYRLNEINNEIIEGKHIPRAKDRRINLQRILDWYIAQASVNRLKSYPDLKKRLTRIVSWLRSDKIVADLQAADLYRYQQIRQQESSERTKKPIKPATIDRDIANLQAMMNRAVQHGLIEANPFQGVKQLREDNQRDRVLTPKEFERLVAALPPDLQPLIKLLYVLPLRVSEARKLKWGQIDFTAGEFGAIRFAKGTTKSGRTRIVPLSMQLREMLWNLPSRFKAEFVFCKPDGKPIGDFKKLWKTALTTAGITDFRVHDLKHCAVTNLLLAAVAPAFIEHMADHASDIMRRRYTTLIEQHVLAAVKIPATHSDTTEIASKNKGRKNT